MHDRVPKGQKVSQLPSVQQFRRYIPHEMLDACPLSVAVLASRRLTNRARGAPNWMEVPIEQRSYGLKPDPGTEELVAGR